MVVRTEVEVFVLVCLKLAVGIDRDRRALELLQAVIARRDHVRLQHVLVLRRGVERGRIRHGDGERAHAAAKLRSNVVHGVGIGADGVLVAIGDLHGAVAHDEHGAELLCSSVGILRLGGLSRLRRLGGVGGRPARPAGLGRGRGRRIVRRRQGFAVVGCAAVHIDDELRAVLRAAAEVIEAVERAVRTHQLFAVRERIGKIVAVIRGVAAVEHGGERQLRAGLQLAPLGFGIGRILVQQGIQADAEHAGQQQAGQDGVDSFHAEHLRGSELRIHGRRTRRTDKGHRAQPQQQDEEQKDAGKVNAFFHRHGAAAVGTPHAEQAAPDKAEPARKHGRTDEAGQEQRQRVFELQRNT